MEVYKLGKIAIMKEDIKYRYSPYNSLPRVNYSNAIKFIKDIQDVWVWRLPTIGEFKFLQQYHNMGVLNFSKEPYWAQDEIKDHGEYNHYGYYFWGIDQGKGRYGGIPKTEMLRVRLVRDI